MYKRSIDRHTIYKYFNSIDTFFQTIFLTVFTSRISIQKSMKNVHVIMYSYYLLQKL